MTNTNTIDPASVLRENHVLIAGDTGSGKSVLLRLLIDEALKNPGAAVAWLIDCKSGVELSEYKDRADRFCFVCDSTSDAIEMLEEAAGIMRAQLASMRDQGLRKWPGAPIYLFVDEFNVLAQMDRRANGLLTFLLQQGRAAGVHVIITTQDPSRTGLPAKIVANCTCRIGLRCATSIESRQIIGVKGCEDLVVGRAYLRSCGHIDKVSIPYSGD